MIQLKELEGPRSHLKKNVQSFHSMLQIDHAPFLIDTLPYIANRTVTGLGKMLLNSIL